MPDLTSARPTLVFLDDLITPRSLSLPARAPLVRSPQAGARIGGRRLACRIGDVMDCAIYARFSSDMQRSTSIDNQVRACC